MRGTPALALTETLIRDVASHLPPEVKAVRACLTTHGWLQVWAVPSDAALDVSDYGFFEVSSSANGGSITSRGVQAPFGLGTWIPLVPGKLAFRLAVTDALDLIRDAVCRVAATWPAPDATVKAKSGNGGVLVWFEDSSGRQVLPACRIAGPSGGRS